MPKKVTDSRFSHVHTDPRFAHGKKKKKKGSRDDADDERFARMHTDADFHTITDLDKYGRRQERKKKEKKEEVIQEEVDEDEEEEEIDEEQLAQESEPIEDVPTGDESKKLALVNLDWRNLRAVDILAVFESFMPSEGAIKRVSVHVSDYGREKMAEEDRLGPQSIWRTDVVETEEKEENSDEEDTSGLNPEAVRRYERDQQKWYFGVIECDSIATASHLYDNCDGVEYQNSGNFIDLRFIPDDVVIDNTVRDNACEVPSHYEPVKAEESALQHSKIDVTWDQPDPHRIAVTTRRFTEAEMEEMDFDAYLASSDSDDSDLEDKRAKYREILDNNDEEAVEDVEITFIPGLSARAEEQVRSRVEDEETTVWDRHLKKRAEKRRERKKARAEEEEKEVVEKKKKKKKKKKRRRDEEGDEKAKAKLELLMMQEPQKNKDKEDAVDDRFAAIYTDPDFAVDPTLAASERVKGVKVHRTKHKTKNDERDVFDIAESLKKKKGKRMKK